MHITPRGMVIAAASAAIAATAAYFVTHSIYSGHSRVALLAWLAGAAAAVIVLIFFWVMVVWNNWWHGMDSSAPPDPRRSRTAQTQHRDNCSCSIILWESEGSGHFFDVITSFSGYSHVSIDCCLRDERGTPLIIESTIAGGQHGPQFAPLDIYGKRKFSRVSLDDWLDCGKLCACLEAKVRDQRNRYKSNFIQVLIGSHTSTRFTCSGLFDACVREQKSSRMHRKLERMRYDGVLWGELAPSDLARAFGLDSTFKLVGGPPRP